MKRPRRPVVLLGKREITDPLRTSLRAAGGDAFAEPPIALPADVAPSLGALADIAAATAGLEEALWLHVSEGAGLEVAATSAAWRLVVCDPARLVATVRALARADARPYPVVRAMRVRGVVGDGELRLLPPRVESRAARPAGAPGRVLAVVRGEGGAEQRLPVDVLGDVVAGLVPLDDDASQVDLLLDGRLAARWTIPGEAVVAGTSRASAAGLAWQWPAGARTLGQALEARLPGGPWVEIARLDAAARSAPLPGVAGELRVVAETPEETLTTPPVHLRASRREAPALVIAAPPPSHRLVVARVGVLEGEGITRPAWEPVAEALTAAARDSAVALHDLVDLPALPDDLALCAQAPTSADDAVALRLIEALGVRSCRSPGLEDALWLAVVPGAPAWVRVGGASAARGLAVCSEAGLSAALRALRASAAPLLPAEPVLRVIGAISSDGRPCWTDVRAEVRARAEAVPGEALPVELLAGDGRAVAQGAASYPHRSLPIRFCALVPLPAAAERLVLRLQGQVVLGCRLDAAPAAPEDAAGAPIIRRLGDRLVADVDAEPARLVWALPRRLSGRAVPAPRAGWVGLRVADGRSPLLLVGAGAGSWPWPDDGWPVKVAWTDDGVVVADADGSVRAGGPDGALTDVATHDDRVVQLVAGKGFVASADAGGRVCVSAGGTTRAWDVATPVRLAAGGPTLAVWTPEGPAWRWTPGEAPTSLGDAVRYVAVDVDGSVVVDGDEGVSAGTTRLDPGGAPCEALAVAGGRVVVAAGGQLWSWAADGTASSWAHPLGAIDAVALDGARAVAFSASGVAWWDVARGASGTSTVGPARFGRARGGVAAWGCQGDLVRADLSSGVVTRLAAGGLQDLDLRADGAVIAARRGDVAWRRLEEAAP